MPPLHRRKKSKKRTKFIVHGERAPAPKFPKEVWENHKLMIHDLYMMENMTLRDVMNFFAQEPYNFTPT